MKKRTTEKKRLMKRISVYLSETQIERLKAIQETGRATGLFVADFIRQAVDEWLERYEKREQERK